MAGMRLRTLPLMQSRGALGSCRKLSKQSSRRTRCQCESSDRTSDSKEKKPRDIKSTIGNIDSLLGIEEEKEEEEEVEVSPDAEAALDVGISAEAFGKLLQLQEKSSIAVLEKASKGKGDGWADSGVNGAESKAEAERIMFKGVTDDDRKGLQDALNREKKRLGGKPEDNLFDLVKDRRVAESVVAVIKGEILGYSTFLVREVERPLLWQGRDVAGSVLLRGNARKDARTVATTLQDGLDKRYGAEQFTVYVVPDQDAEDSQEDGRERFVLQVLPRGMGPPKAAGWQVFASILLLLLTLASTASLAALVAVPKLPPETLAYLASGDRPVEGAAIPGIDPTFDPIPFARVFTEMFFGVVGVNVAHEIGHRILAAVYDVKLGPSLNVPNGSLGSFGAVTPFSSPFRNRQEVFDVAFAGPLCGTIIAAGLFAYGLILSTDPTTDPSILLPLPASVFQGSIVLGSLCESVLGPASGGKLAVHPALLAGWAGLFVQALNLLPVGALDGGRMVRATYGPVAHRLTSILTYIGLTLGFIGGTLSLPFGLFVLIAQRDPESFIKDQVTPTDSTRELLAATMVLFALLVLIPVTPEAPELVDSIQLSLQNDALQGTLQSSSTFQI